MRLGHDSGWIKNSSGRICGVSCGADFTAEHEWGIEDLLRNLNKSGENLKIYGIERRRVNPTKNVHFLEHDGICSLLVYSDYLIQYMSADKMMKSYPLGRNDPTCYWNGENALIRSKDKETLQKIYKELMAGNVAIWLGGSRSPISNAGLCFGVISEIDKENLTAMENADRESERLKKAAEKTGIKSRIDAYNEQWRKNIEVETGGRCYQTPPCGYNALSPSFNKKGKKTKYEVVFWLNPMDQRNNEIGWFTVEELEEWLTKGTGPIVKKGKK